MTVLYYQSAHTTKYNTYFYIFIFMPNARAVKNDITPTPKRKNKIL